MAAGTDPIMPKDSRYSSESGLNRSSSSLWKVMLTCGNWWRSTAHRLGWYSVCWCWVTWVSYILSLSLSLTLLTPVLLNIAITGRQRSPS